MAEVRAIPSCGLKVVSTFSGGGGSSCGYRMAGLDVVLASEFVEKARETYAANFPKTPIDGQDIRVASATDWLDRLRLAPGELDVLDGSPPCASFSTAGKREKGWGETKSYSDTEQRSDDLFFEYARLLKGLQPRAFVAENVSGLVKGTAKGYFKEILAALKACGYRVGARVLDAQWLGVPQARQRLIFVGFREDLGIEPSYPRPFSYRYAIADAIPAATGNFIVENFEKYAIYEEWKKLVPGEASEKYFQLVRPDDQKPCPTVTATGGNVGAASVTHPSEPRKFTIPELKRICSFPDDYVLLGSFEQQWERLGRAVPPLLMFEVAKVVRDKLLEAKR